MKKLFTFSLLVLLVVSINKTIAQDNINVVNGQVLGSGFGTLYDSGGPAGNYSINEDDSVAISIPGAATIKLTFNSFGIETDPSCSFDYLRIYDGIDRYAPLIGQYCDFNTPTEIISTGNSVFIVFHSDGATVGTGFEIDWETDITSPSLVTNPMCNGGNTGSIDLTINGGFPPYTFSWNFGPTTEDVFNIVAGTYAVSIFDKHGHQKDTSFVITEPTSINITPSTTNSTCGAPNGTASAIASGGTPPYTYNWSSGSTSQTATGLGGGTYTVTVTDANACTATTNVTITGTGIPTASISTQTNVNCNGMNDGSATATATGGTAPYSYVWSNTQTTATATGLTAGIYTVTVTDNNGCNATKSVTISQPAMLTASISNVTNVTCNGLVNGSITASVSGGTSPYSYLWTGGSTANPITGLAAGSYTVTVTDNKGCTVTSSATVSQPTMLTSSISTQTNVSCNGMNDGSATVNATGGTAPYTYNWQGGATTATYNNITAGSYSVTVTDNNGCTSTANVNITQPTVIIVTPNTTNSTCGLANGSVSANVTGGTPPYTYNWTGGSTTQTVNSLVAGSYTVTVTDANGCTMTSVANINDAGGPTASISAQTNVTCNGALTGSATVLASGGVSPYSYLWSNSQTSSTVAGLAAGTYFVTVIDNNSCQSTTSVNITEPSAIVTSIIKSDVLCYGGSQGDINLTVSGGVPPYTYSWNGSWFTEDISFLAAGTYNLTVTDNNGCQQLDITTINQPTYISATFGQINPTCNGGNDGSVDLTVSGGTPPYSYLWTGGYTTQNLVNLISGSYTVTVTDANGCTYNNSASLTQPNAINLNISKTDVVCNGSSTGSATVTPTGGASPYIYNWTGGMSTVTITGLLAGNYTVTVTDNNGCNATTSANITEPTAIIVTTNTTNSTCGASNGSAIANVTGGTPPYTYSWTGGSTTQTATGLLSGSYTVTVTDANGCTMTSVANINDSGGPTASIISQINVSCNGMNNGSATVNATSGTAPYTYNWTGGVTTATYNNIPAGSYSVTVTDNNGCTSTANVNITQPTAIIVTPNTTNSTCGSANGSVSANVTGGTPPYTYNWTGGSTTQTVNSLVAGSYTVTVTDANACSMTAVANINDAGAPTANILSQINVSCNGMNDGSATVNATGGAAPYTYLWSTTQTATTATGLTAGSYSVTVTDNNACTSIANVNITQPTAIIVTPNTTNSTCGSANGSVSANVTGGTPPYTYNWTGGSTTQTVNSLVAGSYTVTVTDANACMMTSVANINDAGGPTASIISQTNVTCNGMNNGSATVNATGGTSPYTYLWNNSQSSNIATGLIAGLYDVTVTDANSCFSVTTATITEPTAIIVTPNTTNSTCGAANGSASANVTGGTPPYTYNWAGGSTTQTVNSLVAGSYTVTVTDANACTMTAVANINDAGGPTASISSQTNVTCNGMNDGSASVNATGGTPPYTYNWTGGSTTQTAVGLAAGSYSVTVTDNNACTSTANVNITQPTVLVVTTSKTDATCGLANGSASANVTGGTPPYTYNWTGGSNTQTAAGLLSGSYTVTVTDANGCTMTSVANINDASGPTSTISAMTNVNCNGGADGSATVTITGGTSPFTYMWSNTQTTATSTGLTSGIYTVTVTDNNGCQSIANVTISQPVILTASISNVTNITCNGMNDGSATVTATDGVAPYTYNWQGGATTQTVTGLIAGSYTVTVTDANACTVTSSATVSQPTALIVTSNTTNSTCGAANGSASANITGGTTPYTYSWTGGSTTQTATGLLAGSYTVTVTDANGCNMTSVVNINDAGGPSANITAQTNVACNGTSTGSAAVSASGGVSPYSYLWSNSQTSSTVSGLAAGTYSVTVIDNNSCQATTSVNITQPTALTIVTIATTDASCGLSNGSASAVVTGGTTSYTYLWTDGATTQTASALVFGTYTVTVTDANGCTATNSAVINDLPAPTLTISSNDVLCNGAADGSATVSASGGTTPYVYDWPNSQTTATATGLSAGTYVVTVTDNTGCSVTVPATISEPSALVVSISTTDASCGSSNGSATATVSGGIPAYSYVWTGGATTQTVTGLTSGSYTLTITDANGCTMTSVANISDASAPTVTITAQTNVNCNGGADGSATVTATGGTSPYTYNWTGGQTTATVTNLTAGTYSVTVTDANTCQSTASVVITEPTAVVVTTSATDATCGSSNGGVTATVSGGTVPYVYLWSDGSTTQSVTGLASGSYTVTVTDVNGCMMTSVVSINDAVGPSATIISETNVTCNGGNDGSATVTVTGGVSPFTYLWSNSQTSSIVTGLFAGISGVTVTDNNGCMTTTEVTITEPAQIINNLSYGICQGDSMFLEGAWQTVAGAYTDVYTSVSGCDSTVVTTLNVNTLPIVAFTGLSSQYCKVNNVVLLVGNNSINGVFSGPGISGNNIFNPNNANLGVNTITYSFTDQNGCSAVDSQYVTINEIPAVSVVVTNSDCGQPTGSAQINVTGGISPYTYSTGSSIVSSLSAGNYSVTVTDNAGCTKAKNFSITDNSAPAVIITSMTNSSCSVSCDGTASISVTGGVSPYTILWSSGENTASASALCVGEQSVEVTDAAGCVASDNIVVDYSQPNPTIYGRVTYSGGGVDGQYLSLKVYSRTQHQGGGFDLLTSFSQVASDGTYYLYNFVPDEYVIRAELLPGNPYGYLMNTYYNPDSIATTWIAADTVILNCGQDFEANIIMFELPVVSQGSGDITGGIYYPPAGSKASNPKGIYLAANKAAGEPIPGAEITLEQEPDDAPIANTNTDMNGDYSFENMPEGDYSLRVEIPGFPMFGTYNININATDTIFQGLDFIVDTTADAGNIDTVLVYIPNTEIELMSVSVYPNPSTEVVNISYNLNIDSKIKLEVFDMVGKNIETLVDNNQLSGNYNYTINNKISGLLPGTYFVRLMANNNVYLKKVVIME